jgi:biopolymer transport protein ExbB/TolQ
MPLSAFFVMTGLILLISLSLVLWVLSMLSGWLKARRRVKQLLKVEKARREIKLRALRLKEKQAAEDETSNLYFENYEEYIHGLRDPRT